MSKHTLVPKKYYYTFAVHEPALRVRSGDTVVAETRDATGENASGEKIPPAMKQILAGSVVRESNPVVGPIYVEDASHGDTLSIDIDRIKLNRDYALSKQSPCFGSLTGEGPGHALLYNEPIPEIWYRWSLDLGKNTGSLHLPKSGSKNVEIPLHPFIGSIGVAPAFGEAKMTLTPGSFGGNMDCVDTCEGVTLHLPVWVDGAYLSFGDVHAAQGDGEVNGTALEVTAEVTLTIRVRKDYSIAWPRLEDDDHIMVAGSTRPLFDAVKLAQIELLNWLVKDYGFDREEAWQLAAQVGTMRIGNIVDPLFTVVAKFPKKYLG